MSTDSIQSKEQAIKAKPTPIEHLAYKHLAYSNCGHVRNTDCGSFSFTMRTSDDDGAMVAPAVCWLEIHGLGALAPYDEMTTGQWLSPR